MSLGTLTIHHDYDSGTTVQGTTRYSAAHHALNAHPSWVWSHVAEAWLLRASRNRQSKPAAINDVERVLQQAGYTIERDIDDTMPSVEQQEADRAQRSERRVDRLIHRAQTQQAKAEATGAKANAVFDNIPLGQPMLPGHHSYTVDRNRRERAAGNLSKSVAHEAHARELTRQADTASLHMDSRHNPVTVAERIERHEATRRRLQRELDSLSGSTADTNDSPAPEARERTGHDGQPPTAREQRVMYLRREITTLTEQIDYWSAIYAQLQAEGTASTLGPDQVNKGDWVRYRKTWMRVVRVSKKSVSVPNPVFPAPEPGLSEVTRTVPWHKLSGHRTTAQMPAAFVTAYDTPGIDRIALRPVWAQT